METYDLRVRAGAPAATVFTVLADATRWREWAGAMISTSDWEREGQPPPGGVGAIRKLGRWPAFTREEILEFDPPSHLAYTIRSGFPVRGYHADVDLDDDGVGGSTIHWSGAFAPKVPGTGALLAAVLARIVLGYARAAAREAERQHRAAAR
jgi:uncharacterized protein YndB with AHSA1/START domain